jgi:hypothetical protein
MQIESMTITISCAADTNLAKGLYDYLHSLPLANDISLKEDEIYVDDKINKDALIRSIREFIGSDPGRAQYQLNEFDDIITIGIPAGAGQIMDNMLTCEMCNYMTPYEEQLYLHRMTHGNVVIG